MNQRFSSESKPPNPLFTNEYNNSLSYINGYSLSPAVKITRRIALSLGFEIEICQALARSLEDTAKGIYTSVRKFFKNSSEDSFAVAQTPTSY